MDPFLGKKLLVFTAHPDDEVFVAGGTIYLNHLNGGSVFLACATKGENGRASLGQEISAEEVTKIRLEEIAKAIDKLEIDAAKIFDFPDRGLAGRKKELFDAWKPIIEEIKPEVILGFGRNGYTGHLDHVAAGSVGHKLAQQFNLPYCAFALPGGEMHFRFEEVFQGKRIHGSYISICSHGEPDFRVEVNANHKYKTLKIYQSQFPNLDPYHIFSNKNKSLLKNVEKSLKLLGYHPEVRPNAIRLRKKAEVESFRQLIQFRIF